MMIENLDPSMKIIVIGNGKVGKSTLALKFVKNIFTTEYKQTLGVDFLNIKKYIKKIDQTIDFYIWDTAGQDHFNAITRRYYRGADACLIVFAINDKDSFIQVKSWHKKMKNECGDIPTALVMSKIDLKAEQKISDEEAEKLAKELGIKLFKVSSKEGIMVEECFEYLAEKNYQKNGNYSSGAENIEDVRNGIKFKENNNNEDDDIEELPPILRKSKEGDSKKQNNKNKDKKVGFQLGDDKEQKDVEKNKKNKNCC
jgi:Ras-related protein Rab-23